MSPQTPLVEYKLVLATDVNDLERSVTAMLRLGWVPLGGVAQYQQVWNERVGPTSGAMVPRSQIYLVQAMALPADAE